MVEDRIPEIDPLKPFVIVYGLDTTGRARAGLFLPNHTEIATRAAEKMRLNLIPVNTNEIREIALRLKYGTLYKRGICFIPSVKRELYDRLVNITQTDITAKIDKADRNLIAKSPPRVELDIANDNFERRTSLPKKPTLPRSWDEIKVGDLVIAQANRRDGWWEAIVTELIDDDLALKWCDFPRVRQVRRNRREIALLFPGQKI